MDKGKNKIKKIILDVPCYSQHLDVADKYWKTRACGMACVKMILDYYGSRKTHRSPASTTSKSDFDVDFDVDNVESLEDLIKEGVEKGGYCENGWIHDVLVKMMSARGLDVFRKEYKNIDEEEQKKLIESAIAEKIEFLKKNGLIIVSAIKNFSDDKKFHMVVLVGFQEDENGVLGFYYHDPDARERNIGVNKFVPIDIFKKHWRKMSIYAKM